jgi:hypothetical protein
MTATPVSSVTTARLMRARRCVMVHLPFRFGLSLSAAGLGPTLPRPLHTDRSDGPAGPLRNDRIRQRAEQPQLGIGPGRTGRLRSGEAEQVQPLRQPYLRGNVRIEALLRVVLFTATVWALYRLSPTTSCEIWRTRSKAPYRSIVVAAGIALFEHGRTAGYVHGSLMDL